jgi:hypothetical protein
VAAPDGGAIVTRVYRDVVAGVTWIERGTGTPLTVVRDHGDSIEHQWHRPEPDTLIYDDELHAVESEGIDTERERIRTEVDASSLPATAKATVRKIIGGES